MNAERKERIEKKQEHFQKMKDRDVSKKRMIDKVPLGFYELLTAEFIRIDNDTREFTCKALGHEEYAIYFAGEIVGYIAPAIKKQVVISIRKSGILFQAFFKYTKIKCYVKS